MIRSTSTRRRALPALAIAAVAALATLTTTACEPARPEARDKVVIMVHGYSALGAGTNCASAFGSLSSTLRSKGFTGALVTVGFYDSDTNCNVNLRSWGNIDNGSSWKDLAKAMSAYVYQTYTKKGIAVDLVGHSMGGLVIRGAVYGAKKGESGFSAPLLVEDAVTLAAPHDGAAWYSRGCLWGQCAGLKPGSSELDWVRADGNPQGKGGTEWTVLGSTNDDVVPAASALDMGIPGDRKVQYGNLEHSDYQSNATSAARTADALARVGA